MMTCTTDANIRADWHCRCALAALVTATLLATAPTATPPLSFGEEIAAMPG
jgi:hypothetical protein